LVQQDFLARVEGQGQFVFTGKEDVDVAEVEKPAARPMPA
jgi:hypothetical protein